jgi:predicted transcriptional regulator
VVISLRKKDVFSIVINSTRQVIIKRLGEAGKAAYSDMLDSVDFIQPLNSTGNFNYHLNFLIRNEVVMRDGSVYRLTDDGKKILRFTEDINQMWCELQKELRGETMSVLSVSPNLYIAPLSC